MELESDLAKELFNKVIVPLQTKNKQKEITVQNEYDETQKQLQDTRNKQQELDELRKQGAKAIADEKANRLAQEAETERVAREKYEADKKAQEAEADRLAQEAEAARLAQEVEAARLAQEVEAARLVQEAEAARLTQEESDKKAQEVEAARLAQINVEKQAIEQGDRLITPRNAAKEGAERMKQRETKRLAQIEAATKGAERMAKAQEEADRTAKEVNIPPPVPVSMFNVNQLINILNQSLAMPVPATPVSPPAASQVVPVPSSLSSSSSAVTNFNADPLIQLLNESLSTSVLPLTSQPSEKIRAVKVGSAPEPVSQLNDDQLDNEYNKELNNRRPSTPMPPAPTPVEASPTSTISAAAPTPVEASPTSTISAAAPAIQQQPSTITPASSPKTVASIIPSIDWKGNLDWLKQSVSLLIGSLSNMFTFKAAEDNDPYNLSISKVNEGYIYIGKMYMKNEDETSPSKQVKYVNYHPEKKDFYIDEKPEVVN